ncbi:putative LSM domain superfamily, FDF domain, lsm14-like, DFDF domain-containing protein [Helianthus annuus]|nr:putative LSM domain superfamily, FDF domain, lsm14-like, DFDF domain-containing protein [Helianthus annuus]KAJ0646578.1 putative LSM domain superfamily, FDF domain, lsm14-like, DFDF domain-containing protein [Helianthus annuus]
MATETSRSSTSSADSYIGSLISLTSKSEIRYEGILYNINTEESSIGLRNVRSFGSEGRKKDGPQIMASDKVYEYILFRGSDIKDLQVKTSTPAPSVQPTQPINNDPAIIQSHYPRPGPTSSNIPAAVPGNPMPGLSTHNQQAGPAFQGGMPLYQPDGTMGSWGPSPPPPNVNMYWPGFYAPPNGLPHQQSLFRPTPMQYPGFVPSLPGGVTNPSDYSTSSAGFTTSTSLLASTLPSGLPPVPPLLSSTEPLPSFMQTKVVNSVGRPTAMPPVSLTTATTSSSDINVTVPPVSHKSNGLSGVLSTPSLITPGQLLQSGAQGMHKDVEPPAPAPPSGPFTLPSSGPFAPAPLSGPSALPSSGPSALPSSGPFAPAPSSGPFAPAPLSGPLAPSSFGPFAIASSSGPFAPPASGPFAQAPSSGPSAPAPSSGPSATPSSGPSAPAPSSGPSAAPSSGPSAPAPSSVPSAPSTPAPAPAPAPTPAPAPAPSSEPSAPVSDPTEAQPPILPLPTQTANHSKTNGGPYQNRNSYRGRERGRGSGVLFSNFLFILVYFIRKGIFVNSVYGFLTMQGSRPVMKFTEEFDFTAMNEKFNKDEVWGTLGKSKKSNSKESDEDDFEDENNASALPKIDVKPVYSKDDFFDTLSCNSNDNRNNGRTRFSEQMKLDTETFGEFSRYRGGGRGGRGPNRGGRSRGGGYHGRGYGYVNRARGGRNPARDY